jgi:hypothetical protein
MALYADRDVGLASAEVFSAAYCSLCGASSCVSLSGLDSILYGIFICVHAALGLRVILLDIGARAALHKIAFGCLMVLAVVAFVIVLKYRILYV